MTRFGERIAGRWAGRPRRRRRWHVLITLAGLGLLAAVVGLLAYYHSPRSVYSLALAALGPYLMLGAVVAAVLFGLARGVTGWAGLGVSAAVIVWFVVVQAPLFVAATMPSGGRDVVVLTANLRLGRADPHAIVAAVQAHHVEVLLLEELTAEEQAALHTAGLDSVLPYSSASPGREASGTGLYSRYPISQVDIRDDFGFAFVTARVAVPGVAHPPTVAALHLFGPFPGRQTGLWDRDIRHLPSVLRDFPRDGAVIAGGDFNATRDVAQFRHLLHDGYADATDQAGAGFKPTYPANRFYPPILAIDHVLTRGAVAHSLETIDLPGSDHRGLLVTVRLPS